MKDMFGIRWQYNFKLTLVIGTSKSIFKQKEASQNILFSHIKAHKILIHLCETELRYDREAQWVYLYNYIYSKERKILEYNLIIKLNVYLN